MTVLLTLLPGSDRKRRPSQYRYRLTYNNSEPGMSGCAMNWEVAGGRMIYQVAVERDESGRTRWHCTCADAVYRGEQDPNHRCKHVTGLLECLPLAA